MKSKIKICLYSLIGVLVLAISGFALHYYLLGRAFDARLESFKREHHEKVERLIGGTTSPEANADMHAFVSAATFNDVLGIFVGQRYSISRSSSLVFSRIEMSSDTGTPLINLDGEMSFGKVGEGNSINVKGIATISPPSARDGAFYTRLQLIALEPTIATSGIKLAVNGFFGDLLKAIGQDYLDKMPEFAIPVRQAFSIPVSGSDTAIQFSTRPPNPDVLSGVLHVNGFNLNSAIEVTQAHFLPDGLHLFLGIEGRERQERKNDDSWMRLTTDERLKSLTEPDVDYFTRVNHDALNYMIMKITSLPKNLRTVSFTSTGLNGNLYYWDKVHRGPFKVFLFREEKKVYLEHPDALKASIEVVSFKLANKPGALVGLTLDAALEGRVQLHWHYDPGPSGGVGGNVGVGVPRKLFQIEGSIRLITSPMPKLEAVLDGPDSITINVEVGLGQLGNMPFPQRVSLPKTKLFSASIPTGIQEQIDFKIGSSQLSSKVVISNLTAKPTSYGLSISGRLKIESPQ